jgi:hypothetical protein
MRVLNLVIFLVSVAGCASAPTSEPQVAEKRGEAPPEPADAPPNEDCKVMAAKQCFKATSDACASLGCPAALCELSYSAPPEASCRPSP